MKIGRGSRRSIRFSVFIGVLAGSIFSGSGAFADEALNQANFYSRITDDITNNLNGSYVLESDIDISTVVHTSDGSGGFIDSAPTGTTVFTSFSGTLDGANKTITGLIVPLFYYIGGSVSNLVLEAGTVAGQGILSNTSGSDSTISNVSASGNVTSNLDKAGGLVGESGGSITGSSTSGSVNSIGNTVGGLVGYSAGQVTNSSSSMTTTSLGDYVGGLIGATESLVLNSHASGNVEGQSGVGGLIGFVDGDRAGPVNISESYASGSVNGIRAVGGLIGLTDGTVTIEESYATGSSAGNLEIGGLVGYAGLYSGNTEISASHASGSVTGNSSYAGGLVGFSNYTLSILQTYATGEVSGLASNAGGLVGHISSGEISNSYSLGDVKINADVQSVGGLVGSTGTTTLITSAYASGDVIVGASGVGGGGGWVGGLVGENAGSIEFSYATGNVNSGYDVGGLLGYTSGAEVNSSYASGSVIGTGTSIGGLVGQNDGTSISHSYFQGNVSGNDEVGGLVGNSASGNISNSYARVNGNVTGINYVGGLVGISGSYVNNSFAEISGNVTGHLYVGGLVGYALGNIDNSYAQGNVVGGNSVGGLVGMTPNGGANIYNSYASGQISANFYDGWGYAVGGLVGASCTGCTITHSYSTGTVLTPEGIVDQFLGTRYATVVNSCAGEVEASGNFICGTDPDWFTTDEFDYSTVGLISSAGVLGNTFGVSECINDGLPHIISLLESYEVSSGCGSLPPRLETEFREVVETYIPEKIEKLAGFKKEAQLPRNTAIAFVEPTENFEIANVRAAEITATAKVRVNIKAGQALQVLLKSESKEPVELWVKSSDGSWLLAGVITFDKNGKAILPPLQFKNAGDYSLVLSKPTADSAKGSAPLNQTGSVLVAVS